MKPVQTPFYQIGIVLLQVLGFVAVFFHLGLGGLPLPGDHVDTVVLSIIGLASLGLWATLAYRIWQDVPESLETGDKLSPKAAAIGLLVPIVNLYWLFRVFVGFAKLLKRSESVADSDEVVPGPVSLWLVRATLVSVIFVPLPVVQWILTWITVGRIGRAANDLRATSGQHHPYRRVVGWYAVGAAAVVFVATGWLVGSNLAAPDFPDFEEPCNCDIHLSEFGTFGADAPGFYAENNRQSATEATRQLRQLYHDEMEPTLNPLPLLKFEFPEQLQDREISEHVLQVEFGEKDRFGDRTGQYFSLHELDDHFIILSDGGWHVLKSDLTFDEVVERVGVDELDEDSIPD